MLEEQDRGFTSYFFKKVYSISNSSSDRVLREMNQFGYVSKDVASSGKRKRHEYRLTIEGIDFLKSCLSAESVRKISKPRKEIKDMRVRDVDTIEKCLEFKFTLSDFLTDNQITPKHLNSVIQKNPWTKISPQAIYNYLSGKTYPSLPAIAEIVEVLKIITGRSITVNDLVSIKGYTLETKQACEDMLECIEREEGNFEILASNRLVNFTNELHRKNVTEYPWKTTKVALNHFKESGLFYQLVLIVEFELDIQNPKAVLSGLRALKKEILKQLERI